MSTKSKWNHAQGLRNFINAPPKPKWWYFTALGMAVYIDYHSVRKFLTFDLHVDKSNSDVLVSLAKLYIIISHEGS